MKASGLLVIFLFSFSAFAQNPLGEESTLNTQDSIEGIVWEKGTKKPLSDVNVYLLPQKLKGTTDKLGHFKIDHVPSGKSQVVINLTGYFKLEKQIDITSPAKPIDLYLVKQSYKVFETTISDLRTKKDDSEQTLKQEEFLHLPGSGGDPVKAVQNLAGVNRASGYSSQIIIQGAAPQDTLYNVEGIDVPLIFHFGGLSSIVQPEAVGSVDLLSAGYGADYGRALGGHVGLNLREPQLDRIHGIAYADIFNAGGLVEGPLNDTSGFLVGGRYSYLGYVLKAASKNSSTSDASLTAAPIFYDMNAQYYKKLGPKEEFRFLAINSSDDLSLISNKAQDNDPTLRGDFHQNTKFWRLIPEWSKQFDDSKVNVTLGYGNNDVLFDVGNYYYDLNSKQLSERVNYEKQLTPWWKGSVGLDGNSIWTDANVKLPKGSGPSSTGNGGVSTPSATAAVLNFNENVTSNITGIYLKNEVKPGADSNLTVNPGVRFDDFSLTNESHFEPRLGMSYKIDPSLTLKALSGIYYEEPSVQLVNDDFGNPNLKAEKAYHYAIGFDKEFTPGSSNSTSISVLGFYKSLSNLVVSSDALVNRGGQLTPENDNNSGTGHIQGIELSSKLKRDQWTLRINYTLSQSRLSQPGQGEYASPSDQTHSLTLVGSYQTGNWEYGARFRYVTGDPYTPVIGGFYDSDDDVFVPQRGTFYSARYPAFVQLDVRVDHKWIYDKWILSLYLDIQNITNQKNVESINYSYNYAQTEQINGIPILPTFGVKGEF